MKKKSLSDKLDELFDDPLKGTVKKSNQTTLSSLRSKLEKIEKKYKDKNSAREPVSHPGQHTGKFNAYSRTIERREIPDDFTEVLDIYSLKSVGEKIHPDEAQINYSVWESRFPVDTKHGDTSLNSIFRINPSLIRDITKDKRIPDEISPYKMLFIDTETTGLAGGTGTLAFLIGAGYFEKGNFVVRQYFMKDYGEEESALNAFIKFASDFQLLVTFNGRGYDVPLIDTRLILNNIKFNLGRMPHFDLLYPARSIYKHRLESCRLQSLERNILRFFREEDIPSDEIPYLYFKYLRSKNPALMDRVFYHNNMDIVSLAVLAAKLCELCDVDIPHTDAGEDLFGIAHMFYNQRDYPRSEFFYLQAMSYTLPYDLRKNLLKEYSMILKRTNRFDEAEEIWKGMIDGLNDFDIFPFEELAKYYEHTKKSFYSAIKIVQSAAEFLEEQKDILDRTNYLDFQSNLLHRLTRLERKLKN